MAQGYTLPVVVSFCKGDGSTGSLIGAFIVLNEEGWILTACHIVEEIKNLTEQCALYSAHVEKVSQINSDKSLNKAKRKKELRQLNKPTNPIVNLSVWWGRDGWNVESFQLNKLADISIGQIRGFDKKYITTYPEFKNPTVNFNVGENLCKLGFPFYNIKPTYDESKSVFQLPQGTLPIPLFPIEGIFTRTAVMKKGESSAEFVETSSPGLRGQSGGPTFDAEGRIWAMQSRTVNLPLGFSPKVPNQQNREHQFLNVGLGTHANAIIKFLNAANVKFHMSQD